MTPLNLTSLEKAIDSFQVIIDTIATNTHADLDEVLRDALIKRFKYCYELSKKMLLRHLKYLGEDDIDQLSLENAIRLRAKKGILLNSWDVWKDYRENHNHTAHTYDENIASSIA